MARAAAQHTPSHARNHAPPELAAMERQALRDICEFADVLQLDGEAWLLVPASPAVLDVLAAFEVDEDGDPLDAGEEDRADDEFSLGAPDHRVDQTAWLVGLQAPGEPEEDDPGEDDGAREPALGAPEGGSRGNVNQAHWGAGDLEDHEVDDSDLESTAPERAGRGFVRCRGDDLEDGGDTEFDPGEWGIADKDAVEEECGRIIWPDPATAAAVEAGRREARAMLASAIGERHGRPYIADPTAVRLLGERAAATVANLTTAERSTGGAPAVRP